MSTSITNTTISLGGIDLVGSSNTLTLTGTNPTLAGVHTLNVSNTLQIGGTSVATTTYVDNTVNGRIWLESVVVASTANINTSTDLQNDDTIDGVTLATGNRVLLKDQTNAVQNGIYVVVASGAAGRATDLAASDAAASVAVFVQEGTANHDKAFVCTNNTGSDEVGTDELVFTQFGGDAVIANNAITTDKLNDLAVTTAKLNDDAVSTDKVQNEAITGAKIASATITSANIDADTITGGPGGNIASGTITGDNIGVETITANNIQDGTITNNEIQAGTITGSNIAGTTITAANIAAATITSAKVAVETLTGGVNGNIALATITYENIANESITGGLSGAGGNIGMNTITSDNIASATITAANISGGTITFNEISAETVTGGTGGNIAPTTITAYNILGGTITTAEIAADTILTNNIADNAVSSAKIDVETVTGGLGGNIAATTITSYNIAAETVTGGTGGNIGLETITADNLVDYCVTMVKLGDGSIDYSKFALGAVNNDALGAQCVTADKIAANTITRAQIEAGTITDTEIDDATITGNKLAAGTITATQIQDGTITGPKLAAGTIAATELGANAVTGAKLNSNVTGFNMVYNNNFLDVVHKVFNPVRCATIGNVNPVNALEAGDTLDGLTLAAGDRVLVKAQGGGGGGGAHVDNGIYVVQGSGAAQRAADMWGGRSNQLAVHSTVFVTSGTVNGGTTWRVSATGGSLPTAILVGTDTTTWTRVEAPVLTASIAPGTFTAGVYSFGSSTITNLGSVNTADINGGTIDNTDITVGSGRTLNVSAAAAFTTSQTQNKNIIQGANDNVTFGNFTVTAQTFATVSDSRNKTNINTIKPEDGMAFVRSIRGVKYNMKSNDVASAGVIAQEVQEIAPELVTADANGMLTMNYDGLNGYLVPAIQMLYDKIDELEEEVDNLKRKRNLALPDQLDQLDQLDQPVKLARLAQ
jgi:hypothetical protein